MSLTLASHLFRVWGVKKGAKKRQIIGGLGIFNATDDEALKRPAKPVALINNYAAV